MPDANDTNENAGRKSPLDRLFEDARENLAQFESGRGMTPHYPSDESEIAEQLSNSRSRETWPTMIYVMPGGEVIARRELARSSILTHQSLVTFKVSPEIKPGNSGGGQACKIEVIKFRGDMHDFFKSVAQSFLTDEESERSLLKAIFPHAKLKEIESLAVPGRMDSPEHPIDCTCIYCIPGE